MSGAVTGAWRAELAKIASDRGLRLVAALGVLLAPVTALLAVGRCRGVRVAAVLGNVVAWQQGVQEGVADYAAAEPQMLAGVGEHVAIRAALSALTR